MSRSCQRAMSSSAAPAWARSMRASPVTCSHSHRVPLVGHRGGALLALGERLLRLQDLRPLEAPDLRGDPLEAPARDRAGGHELGVTVPLDDLGGDGLGLEPEGVAHLLLEVGRHVSEGPDRAGDLPHPDRLPGPHQSLAVPPGLRVPAGGLEAERGRLGVDAVGPADRQRVPVPEGQAPRGSRGAGPRPRSAGRPPRRARAPAPCRPRRRRSGPRGRTGSPCRSSPRGP